MATEYPVWHHLLHRVWAYERLFYCFLSLRPTYETTTARYKVARLLQQRGIRSFAIHELFGSTDLVARLWMPDMMPMEQLELAFEASFGGATKFRISEVDMIIRHFVWADQAPPPEPRPEQIANRLANIDFDRIDSGELPPDEREHLAKEHMFTTFTPAPGITFFVEVHVPRSTSLAARRAMLERLCKIVDHAPATIKDKSLYRLKCGESYLVSGCVAPASIFDVSTEIADRINDITGLGSNGGRTFTHLATHGDERSIHHDRMASGSDDDEEAPPQDS